MGPKVVVCIVFTAQMSDTLFTCWVPDVAESCRLHCIYHAHDRYVAHMLGARWNRKLLFALYLQRKRPICCSQVGCQMGPKVVVCIVFTTQITEIVFTTWVPDGTERCCLHCIYNANDRYVVHNFRARWDRKLMFALYLQHK